VRARPLVDETDAHRSARDGFEPERAVGSRARLDVGAAVVGFDAQAEGGEQRAVGHAHVAGEDGGRRPAQRRRCSSRVDLWEERGAVALALRDEIEGTVRDAGQREAARGVRGRARLVRQRAQRAEGAARGEPEARAGDRCARRIDERPGEDAAALEPDDDRSGVELRIDRRRAHESGHEAVGEDEEAMGDAAQRGRFEGAVRGTDGGELDRAPPVLVMDFGFDLRRLRDLERGDRPALDVLDAQAQVPATQQAKRRRFDRGRQRAEVGGIEALGVDVDVIEAAGAGPRHLEGAIVRRLERADDQVIRERADQHLRTRDRSAGFVDDAAAQRQLATQDDGEVGGRGAAQVELLSRRRESLGARDEGDAGARELVAREGAVDVGAGDRALLDRDRAETSDADVGAGDRRAGLVDDASRARARRHERDRDRRTVLIDVDAVGGAVARGRAAQDQRALEAGREREAAFGVGEGAAFAAGMELGEDRRRKLRGGRLGESEARVRDRRASLEVEHPTCDRAVRGHGQLERTARQDALVDAYPPRDEPVPPKDEPVVDLDRQSSRRVRRVELAVEDGLRGSIPITRCVRGVPFLGSCVRGCLLLTPHRDAKQAQLARRVARRRRSDESDLQH
jgi:hypothetical protein